MRGAKSIRWWEYRDIRILVLVIKNIMWYQAMIPVVHHSLDIAVALLPLNWLKPTSSIESLCGIRIKIMFKTHIFVNTNTYMTQLLLLGKLEYGWDFQSDSEIFSSTNRIPHILKTITTFKRPPRSTCLCQIDMFWYKCFLDTCHLQNRKRINALSQRIEMESICL